MSKNKLVTICNHDKEYDEGKCPLKNDAERYQGNHDINKRRDDVEEN
jgi:hypothetical protein